MVSIILGTLGLLFLAFGVYLKKRNVDSNAKFSVMVNAKVIGLKEAGPYDKGRKTYYPSLKFTYDGKTYLSEGSEFVSDEVKINDVFTIFINPECPRSVRLVKSGETLSSIAAKVFGGVLLIIAALFYFL